eukprot:8961625-Pyramimonas_sp.AAC.1
MISGPGQHILSSASHSEGAEEVTVTRMTEIHVQQFHFPLESDVELDLTRSLLRNRTPPGPT